MKQNHTKLFEWAVWANLDKKRDLELILLKGHLIIEIFMDNLLSNGGVKVKRNLGFSGKAGLLAQVPGSELINIEEIISHLKALNEIRNKFAHEWDFDINEGEIEQWSLNVLSAFNGEKFTKFTYRAKIIHAFSALSGELVEIQQ